ncbi:NAD(P)H-dependent oxidoreductase [Candidatus Thiodiazotropha endoloripes]|uniref:NAD(P)H-dependent oxidoreductase n=1 Tax=Candidatus Thiodiazotropha endoloripes TaxID=1818881 RepID=UPI0026800B16|nr:NAD(P)H-dependent oxidoreductase [Candidatus Thiodiazotropha endoloripes]
MKNILIINAHEPYPVSPGKLNNTLIERATRRLTEMGYEVRTTSMNEAYEVDSEVEKHLWADAIILQTPVNWMGVPWRFKQYMDTVYAMAMAGLAKMPQDSMAPAAL